MLQVGAELAESVRRELKSAQRRFDRNRAITTQEIQRGLEAELGGGTAKPKKVHGHSTFLRSLARDRSEVRVSDLWFVHSRRSATTGAATTLAMRRSALRRSALRSTSAAPAHL